MCSAATTITSTSERSPTSAKAATEIVDSCEWEDIGAFAHALDVPWSLGEALAHAQRFEHESDFLEMLGSDDPADATFAAGYVWKRFRDDRWGWLDAVICDGLSPRQIARLLLYTHDHPRAWEVADELGQEVADAFWGEFRNHGLGEFEHVDFAARRLLDVGRRAAALDLVALYSRKSEEMTAERAEFVAEGLEALLADPSQAAQMQVLSRHDLMELFAALDASALPRKRVAQLEWGYLPVFGIDARPTALAAMLSEEPQFFVDLITWIYRPRRAEEGEADQAEEGEATQAEEPDIDESEEEQRRAVATNAYRLLSEWKRIPGLCEDGTVDPEQLEAWVTAARAKLAESGHEAVGDSHIGRVLAAGPPDEDGSRPGVAVRNLLERLQNPDIEDGLRVELYNSRGPTTRGAFDGGEQEREVAAMYSGQSEKFADRWPRATSVMRELAEGYERDARRLDEEAERRRKGFDT